MGKNQFLRPGTKVIRGTNDPEGIEFGVVIHCWQNEEHQVFDCYVAFFGKDGFPKNKPSEKPYILRYASTSLSVVSDPQAQS